MPIYEFRCSSGSCPTYEVWRAIDERHADTECPDCGGEGKRLFNPPMTLSGSLRLRQESREPRLVTRQPQREEAMKPRLRQSDSRPWMVTRGC